jgi:hypothetical protein
MLAPVELEPYSFKILVEESERRALDPMVVSTSPEHDSPVGVKEGRVALKFDRAMDRESVEKALEMIPAGALEFDWNEEGSEISIRCRAAKDTPVYRVRVGEGARDVNGRSMHAAFEVRIRKGETP